MKLQICLSRTVLVFLCILAPLIIAGSLYNLIYGLILHETDTVSIGPFSLGGFILFPLIIGATYVHKKCVIDPGNVRIGKVDYPASQYSFHMQEKQLPFKERPVFFLAKKNYPVLVIKDRATGAVIKREDLHVFKSDLRKIEAALPL